MDPYTFGGANRMLATFVPDEIIFNEQAMEPETIRGVLFFVDVSGFTNLCEKYYGILNKGRAKFTDVLNSYIGSLVNEIIRYKGDVLKFSGDALLALWKSHSYISTGQCMQAAIDCALAIQKKYGEFKTDIGSILRVKIAVTAGVMVFSVIGGSNFMILGKPIWEIKEAGNICEPGYIVIGPSGQPYLHIEEYQAKTILEKYILISDYGIKWKGRFYLSSYDVHDDKRFSYFENYIIRQITGEIMKDVELYVYQKSDENKKSALEFDQKHFDSVEDIHLRLSNKDHVLPTTACKIYTIDRVALWDGMYNIILRPIEVNWKNTFRTRDTIKKSYVDNEILPDLTLRPAQNFSDAELKNLERIQGGVQYYFIFADEEQETLTDCQKYILVGEPVLPYARKNCEERTSLIYATKYDMKNYLSKFIISPVVNAVNEKIPVEYLTEMRQVITVVVNVVLSERNSKQILSIIDGSYGLICSIVNSQNGCVNKVSIFDKDLMFIIIFGLRGYTHILQADRALISAKDIRTHLMKHSEILQTSVAVVAGINYTGVVGSERRREFTVIGRAVNKAARLTCAYPDKVTCNRQVLLDCTFKSEQFILLEPQLLKGFQSTEPIYEFCSFKISRKILDQFPNLSKYTLLDRDKEMQIFHSLLNEALISFENRTTFEINEENILEKPEKFFSKVSLESDDTTHRCNILLLKGDGSQGRSRMLVEMIKSIPPQIISIICSPVHTDAEKPYISIRYILDSWLHMDEIINIENRTEIIKQYFTSCHSYLCGLNNILNVNFPKTFEYDTLNAVERELVKSKLLLYLCQKNSKELHMVFIDCGKCLDKESLHILEVLSESDFFFLCVTVNLYLHSPPFFTAFENRRNTKIINLSRLEDKYHAALICQQFNVRLVDVEIVRYIQKQSNGNPGWISKFLRTLLDWKEVQIKPVEELDEYNTVFVKPPLQYIYKNADYNEVCEEITVQIQKGQLTKDIVVCYDECSIRENQILVALLSPHISLNEIDIEDSTEMKLMQLYDSLPYGIDNLLKLAAYIGNAFHREALEFVMDDMIRINILKGIQYMFTMRLVVCAHGRKELGFWQNHIDLVDLDEEPEIKCNCIGYTNEKDMQLPSYAYCGYMRFRQLKFREMLRNFLTAEKIKSHATRLIPFIQLHITRCESCGGGFFLRLNGRHLYDPTNQFLEEQIYDDISMYMEGNASYVSLESNIFKKFRRGSFIEKRLSYIKEFFFHSKYEPCSTSIKLYEDHDFKNCTCLSHLYDIYKFIVDLYDEAEMHEEKVHVLLEYANLCIVMKKFSKAETILDNTQTVLQSDQLMKIHNISLKLSLIVGRLCTLRGKLLLALGIDTEAKYYLEEAARAYKIKFPTRGYQLKNFLLKKKQNVLLKSKKHLQEEYEILLADQVSELMSNFYVYFINNSRYKEAKLAANWALNTALKSNSEFFTLCTAHTNVTQMSIFKNTSKNNKIEDSAYKTCSRRNTKLEIQEFEAVTKLYIQIFIRKFFNSDLPETIKAGLSALQLCSKFSHCDFKVEIFPLLVKALVFGGDAKTAYTILRQHSRIFDVTNHRDARKIYYTTCMEFTLDTGICVIPLQNCEEILQENPSHPISITEMKFRVVLWIWYLRKKNFSNANKLLKYTTFSLTRQPGKDPTWLLILLRILEGYILLLVKRIKENNELERNILVINIKELLRYIENYPVKLVTLKARFYHLKAYFCILRNKNIKSRWYLKKAKLISKMYKIDYEMNWIKHNIQNWKFGMGQKSNFSLKGDHKKSFENKVSDYEFYTLPLNCN